MANVAIPLFEDADDADLAAVANYVENQRPKIPQFPGLQSKIESFEEWYQGLGTWDLDLMINDTIAEAYRRRDEINRVMGSALPVTSIPADKINMKPGAASGLAGAKPPLFSLPKWVVPAAVISGAVTVTLVVLKSVRKLFMPF